MAKLALLLALGLIASGCGSSSATKTSTLPPAPGPGRVIYQGTAWAVVVAHGKAVAQQLVGGRWQPASAGTVHIDILGPKPGSTGNPAQVQVAAGLSAGSDLAESALWVDGVELLEKGGGLTPTKGTIYGTTTAPLEPGTHTAVAYARTATHATAVAWTFTV